MSVGTGTEHTEVLELLADVETDKTETAFGRLIEQLWGPMERGIRAAFEAWDLIDHHSNELIDPGDMAIEASGQFLAKLKRKSYRRSLADADDPLRYAFGTAQNLTRDLLSKSPPSSAGDEDSPSQSRRELERVDLAELRADAPLIEADRAKRAAGELERALEGLPLDSLLLLEVAYVELRALPESHVKVLAEKRGVTTARVKRELAERVGRQRKRRNEYLAESESRVLRLAAIQREIRRVVAVIRECGDEQVDEAAPLTAERTQELRQSNTALRKATPEERAAYLDRLHERESTQVRKRQEAHTNAQSEMPAGKHYEELVQILGLAPDDPKEHKKAINALTQKLARLGRRIRKEWGL